MPHPSLFHVLLVERRWDQWSAFCLQFERVARDLARELGRPKLASVTVSRKSFHRWAKGDWYGRPWPDTALILEHLFEVPAADLFSSAPDPASASTSPSKGGALHASVLVAEQWPTTRFFMGPGEAVGGWELAGRQALDGTTAAVAFRAATGAGCQAHLDAGDAGALEEFLRPARRGFLIGVDDRQPAQLFVATPRLPAVTGRHRPAKVRHPCRELTYWTTSRTAWCGLSSSWTTDSWPMTSLLSRSRRCWRHTSIFRDRPPAAGQFLTSRRRAPSGSDPPTAPATSCGGWTA